MKGKTLHTKKRNSLVMFLAIFSIISIVGTIFLRNFYYNNKSLANVNTISEINNKEAKANLEFKQVEAHFEITEDEMYRRIGQYGSRTSGGEDAYKFLLTDLGNEEGVIQYKELYCIRPGTGVKSDYDVYDLYSLGNSENAGLIEKYFGDDAHYKHFLWILENMYITGSGEQALDEYFRKIGEKLGEAKEAELRAAYDAMLPELGILYRGDNSNSDSDNCKMELFQKEGIELPENMESIDVNIREQFIKTMQSYILNTCALRTNNEGYGSNLIYTDERGIEHCDIYIYKKTFNENGELVNDQQLGKLNEVEGFSNSYKFAKIIWEYLSDTTNSEYYTAEKYIDFDAEAFRESVIIDKSNAKVKEDGMIGPFYITKPIYVNIDVKEFWMSELSTVEEDRREISSGYEIVDENRNKVQLTPDKDYQQKEIYINVTDDEIKENMLNKYFHLTFNADYGNIIKAKFFYPTSRAEDTQDLINVDKEHYVKDFEWSEAPYADIALKKYITKVNGNSVESRLKEVNSRIIKNQMDDGLTVRNAEYKMVKTPIEVNYGDIVTYAIQLFNEGSVDGTAKEIADYLPNGLEYNNKTYMLKDETKGDTEDNREYLNIRKIDKNDQIIIDIPFTSEDDYIKAYDINNPDQISSKTIYIECKVTGMFNGDYTNVSEITAYKFKFGTDSDSEAANWNIGTTDRNSSEWINYRGKQQNDEQQLVDSPESWVRDNVSHIFWGQEDDDDFDKISTKKIDLALTKSINGVLDVNDKIVYLNSDKNAENDGATKNMTKISVTDGFINGNENETDLMYKMNKAPATVQIGDRVVSTITVYNEGQIPATVKEITDYLPIGLDFDETSTKKLNTNDVKFTLDGRNVKITIKENAGGAKLDKFNVPESATELTDANKPSSYTVYIVAKVTGNTTTTTEENLIYNSAAITNYGYTNENNEYVSAEKKGTDRDSVSTVVVNDLKKKHNDEYSRVFAAKDTISLDNIEKNELQDEDDDDVDCIRVIPAPRFDLALRKFIYKIEDEDKTTSENYSDRIPDLNEKSLATWEGTGTAEYNHRKVKVDATSGNLVTYRIRVYNEGGDRDYAGVATKITDYLPEKLEFVKIEDGFENDWKAEQIGYAYKDSKGNERKGMEVILTYTKVDNNDVAFENKVLQPNSIRNIVNKTEGFNYQEVGIVCKIRGNAEGIITNRAAITEHRAFDKYEIEVKDSKDSDSHVEYLNNPKNMQENELNSPKLDIWYAENVVPFGEDTIQRTYYPGQEDDDDFDTLNVKLPPIFDLSLRKFVSEVNGVKLENSREPQTPDLSALADNDRSTTNINYNHTKQPLIVKRDDLITYTIRVYNEGEVNGYAAEITDRLPECLEFVADNEVNKQYGWEVVSEDGRTIKTSYLAKGNENLIKAFNGKELDSKEVKIVCRVSRSAGSKINLTNIAEINKSTDENGKVKEDIDSKTENVEVPKDSELPGYKDSEINKEFVPGQEDDDDFEKVYVEVNGGFNFTVTKKDSETNKVIESEKTTFDIKVYSKISEEKDGDKAKVTFSKDDIITLKNSKGETINTNNISASTNGITSVNDIMIDDSVMDIGKYYFVIEENEAPDEYTKINYNVVVPVTFKEEGNDYKATHDNSKAFALVKDGEKEIKYELNKMSTKQNECVSTEETDVAINVNVPNVPKKFDLSLRKFITKVNNEELASSRVPETDCTKLADGTDSTAQYSGPKNPLDVNPQDVVEYTIRVYNEGERDGYASKVMDDVPYGVQMISPEESELNKQYRWKMYKVLESGEETGEKSTIVYDDKTYVETDKSELAVLVVTDYLSKENGEALRMEANTENPNLLQAFDKAKGEFTEANYRDVKVQFKVKVASNENMVITNYAQITEHTDKNGKTVKDTDSTPNKWIEGDDDQDIEKIKVKYFDLALYKWVTSAIVTENGKTTEYSSGHSATNKLNIIDVSIPKDKLNNVVVKFKYQIKVENQGQIAGYAKEVKDHVPAGLKFVEADNTGFNWKQQSDGTITTDYLKDTLLQPGESSEVTVVLTWINGSDNFGKKVNYAEISQDYNNYGAPDIDSTPNNFKDTPREDDEDEDEVLLQIRTGINDNMEYIIIGLVAITIIAFGVVGIKKYVIDRK